ncbi:hypothetical protein L6452_32373 [Arctium lappa]|uniref:Uncharacterized protein n=1 Tax=Arctium lappa TaxID=4217 RepID=A0ACB8Z4C8_ARCLA|nr:hypothetical protein L6452_32373 [Arctium lappa]
MRKQSHEEEMESRNRYKTFVSQQKRDDSLKTRHNISDGMHNKRANEEFIRRGDRAEREEPLHAHIESTSRHKPERDDNLYQYKRDEQARPRDDDQHSFRYKEE